MANRDDVVIRSATAADHAAIVELAGTALVWRPDEPNAELFHWKHVENPFGASPMWIVEEDGRPVAFRTFLRWQFDDPRHGPQLAVRAVDTATHPDAQGRGLFRALTLHALDELRGTGVHFVFNTPNDQSRPGYLKMGWQDMGRVPVAVSISSPASLVHMMRARVPASKWSLDAEAGEPAATVLADEPALRTLLASQPPPSGLRTRRDAAFLRWRYTAGPLQYRALLRTSRLEDGVALFRLRSRGAAVEATLCDVIVPDDDARLVRALIRSVRRTAHPDYVIRVQRPVVSGTVVRVPGQGPRLTWRAVDRSSAPGPGDWDLRLGDIELF